MVKNGESRQEAQRQDELLVRDALRGESGSFDTLVRRYQSVVYAVTYRLVQNREDALDIAQDVFVKAFRSLHTWQPTGAFKSWLLRIATNMSIDHLRRRSRTPTFVDTNALGQLGPDAVEEGARIKEPSERVSELELGAVIRTAVDTLPEKQRTVFILRHYEGLPLREIAEIMNCTEGTIKTHLFRATGKLRNELDGVRRDFMRG
jgi:RNA polymerase sigma-70 factor (ECF subfamily)